MTTPIAPVTGITLPAQPSSASSKPGGAFQDVLSNAIQQVEAFGQNASASVNRFLSV
jgi:hypothetical protein